MAVREKVGSFLSNRMNEFYKLLGGMRNIVICKGKEMNVKK